MDNTVLVLGARGRLGGAVAKAFAAAGWRVLTQRRAGGNGARGGGLASNGCRPMRLIRPLQRSAPPLVRAWSRIAMNQATPQRPGAPKRPA